MNQTPKRENPLKVFIKEFREANLFEKILTAFLLFIPVAFLAEFLHFSPVLTFFIAAFAIMPLAKVMGDATEALSHRAGTTIGGLLNATFGNAVELIISIIALTRGLNEVVKASITGSIIGNVLFVLGLSMFTGGLGRKRQLFNRVGASAAASQLSLAAIALIMPAAFIATVSPGTSLVLRDDLLENLSLVVSGIMLLSYFGQLVFFLHTHSFLADTEISNETPEERNYGKKIERSERQIIEEESTEETAAWSLTRALVTLLIATVIVGLISEILVGSIEPLTRSLGWTELFVGVILIAIIGNAAEHLTAVTVAIKNKMNLSINIALGSSLQIALLVAPILVFLGYFTGHPLDLRFDPFELVSIVVSILIVNRVVSDGESNWFEGMQLLAVYFIIAVAFFLHP